MGLDTASIKFLCAAKSLGVNFTNLLMVGRQWLFPDSTSLQLVFSTLEIDRDAEDFLRENKYGERFFSLLGAQQINSLDYSSYEDATILHDMNAPIPDDLHQRFSVVYDGGTLEHVFNVPQALKNCMQMVRVGGHFMQVNAANNYMGHGFWQFSRSCYSEYFHQQMDTRLKRFCCMKSYPALHGMPSLTRLRSTNGSNYVITRLPIFAL